MARERLPVVYLPVELQSRELDSKLLLAAELTARGYTVVLGQQWMLFANLDRLPPGAMLFKSFNRIHQPAMLQARQFGHRVVALEEELLAQIEERAVVAMCAEGIFDAADLILCDGRFEHDILKRLGGGKSRLEITGNGRIDLLKPSLQAAFAAPVAEVKRKHGEFVLVNTNFSILNSIWESVEQVTAIQLQAGFVRQGDAASMRTWQDYVRFEEANRAALHVAVRELAKRRPKEKIILRPHPGEELKRWDGVFGEFPNVAVIREGSHVPWTLASRVLLHTSCTTGFEAHVAGKPALSLVPQPGWISSSLISNQVNPVFQDPLALVAATERILDGGAPPAAPATAHALEDYIWNAGANDATRRIAELLVEGLPAPRAVALPALREVARDRRLKTKFSLSPAECAASLQRIVQARGLQAPQAQSLGDSLFLLVAAPSATRAAPLFDHATLRQQMKEAGNAGNYQQAYDLFRLNFGEAHRHGDLCLFAGMALFEMGKHALALQYFQGAANAAQAVELNIAGWLARTYHRLGDLEMARRYAALACDHAPLDAASFDLYRELCERTGKPAPAHWLMIGCSHARYFTYLQLNRVRFFGDQLHLECYEFPGATAYGLGHADARAGALNATRKLRDRLARADRVLVYFGEIDCRRAAWKAAATAGRPIEEMIGQSAERVREYVAREILPHNRKVLVVGAKPQIIADADFYQNALEDERTVFQPLAERERITLYFNGLLRAGAAALKVDYVDIDHVLADEKSRRQFFRKAFWDEYTTDTHGSVDYFAGLYHRCLQQFLD